MFTILSKEYWVLDTKGVDDTLLIGFSFIILTYVLHPAVESAYMRARAHRAWRVIENNEAVEVTSFPMLQEIFVGRGNWDAPRMITVMLALFSLACWGLELSIRFPNLQGLVYLVSRSPPVKLGEINGLSVWEVKSREGIDYDGDWENLPNMFHDHAKSRYYTQNDGRRTGEVNGDLVVAYWNTEPNDTLFYYTGDDITTVESLQCADDVTPNIMDVYHGGILWGTAVECENGPKLTSDLLALHQDKRVTPPTILLKNLDEEVFLIVEESSNSPPSFLYSSWTIQTEDGIATELQHEFQIAATMRLAEAVVTGIVQGERSGGGCFGLLRKYSENRELYSSTNNAERALPFGERPSRDTLANIQDIESIRVGLATNAIGLLCMVCIAVLASIGIVWSVCVHSSVGMDVYDRDELVRAASANGAATGGIPPSASRIFVRKEDEGSIGVVVSGATASRRGFAWAFSGGALALASLAWWGLELSMDLAQHSGPADMLNRPPPVIVRSSGGVDTWKVTPDEDLDYYENWKDVLNMYEDDTCPCIPWRTAVGMQCGANGDFTAAYLCPEADETPFYHIVDLATTVEDVECVGDKQHDTMDEQHENDL